MKESCVKPFTVAREHLDIYESLSIFKEQSGHRYVKKLRMGVISLLLYYCCYTLVKFSSIQQLMKNWDNWNFQFWVGGLNR